MHSLVNAFLLGRVKQNGCFVPLKTAVVDRKSRQPNYVVQEVEHTWSAFTFQQMVPQKLSFDVHYWSARASIRAIRRSADMAARARDC